MKIIYEYDGVMALKAQMGDTFTLAPGSRIYHHPADGCKYRFMAWLSENNLEYAIDTHGRPKNDILTCFQINYPD